MSQKVINLFGGPGTGKSETASGVFNLLKRNRIRTEYVQEFAKDLTWEGNKTALACQDFIFGNQLFRMFRLSGQVEFIVTDSPLLLTPIYSQSETLNAHAKARHKEFENYNFFLTRVKPYDPVGRSQTATEAEAIDEMIKLYLVCNQIPFVEVVADDSAPVQIVELLLNQPNRSGGGY